MTATRGGVAARIAAATPPHRDRTVDALRAAAMLGVVLGHWLVTAVVADPYRGAALHGASPLSHAPSLTPASWLLETLGPFFFAGGYAAARGLAGRTPARWLRSRLPRLVRPALVLAAVWLPAGLLLAAAGTPAGTLRLTATLVADPLWFLLAFLVLTALTPPLRAAVHRYGPWAAAAPLALVAVSDATGPTTWLAPLVVPVAWAAPYLLGIALAENHLPRRTGPVLLSSGVLGAAALVVLAGYPASAVGVPGGTRSNLDPPSLFAMALAAAQIGAFLLARPWLARLLRRPAVWAPVAVVNLVAVTVYCWHQTAMLLVTFAALPFGRPAGLLGPPVGGWPWHRLAWLPLFALVLLALVLLFHRQQAPGRILGHNAGLQAQSRGRSFGVVTEPFHSIGVVHTGRTRRDTQMAGSLNKK